MRYFFHLGLGLAGGSPVSYVMSSLAALSLGLSLFFLSSDQAQARTVFVPSLALFVRAQTIRYRFSVGARVLFATAAFSLAFL